MNASKAALVAALPRRTAHALHALLEASAALHMPPTAAEVVVYDAEAANVRGTAAALRHAQRLGYCACTRGGYWVPGNAAYELGRALEDRYLAETEEL